MNTRFVPGFFYAPPPPTPSSRGTRMDARPTKRTALTLVAVHEAFEPLGEKSPKQSPPLHDKALPKRAAPFALDGKEMNLPVRHEAG
jgi:hypothetical protein